MKPYLAYALFCIVGIPCLAQEKVNFPEQQALTTKWNAYLSDAVGYSRLDGLLHGKKVVLKYKGYSLGTIKGQEVFSKVNGYPQAHSVEIFYGPTGKPIFYHYKIWEYHYIKNSSRPSYLGDELNLRVMSYVFERKRGLWPWQWTPKFKLVKSHDGDENSSRREIINFLKERYNLTTDFFWW